MYLPHDDAAEGCDFADNMAGGTDEDFDAVPVADQAESAPENPEAGPTGKESQ